MSYPLIGLLGLFLLFQTVSFGGINNALALSCLEQSLEQEFDDSDIVFFGKVVKQEPSSKIIPYMDNVIVTFQVLEYFKGTSSSVLITNSYIDDDFGWEYIPGKEMMIFANQDSEDFINVDQLCSRNGVYPDSTMLLVLKDLKPESPETFEIVSPRMQIFYGVTPENVICKEGLVLIIKYSGSPACVKLETAVILEERGWGGMSPP